MSHFDQLVGGVLIHANEDIVIGGLDLTGESSFKLVSASAVLLGDVADLGCIDLAR